MATRFSKEITQLIIYGKEEASRLQTPYANAAHIMLGIIRNKNCNANRLLSSLEADTQIIKKEIEECIPSTSIEEALQHPSIELTDDARMLLNKAMQEAQKLNCEEVGSEHVLLSALGDKDFPFSDIFMKQSINYDMIKEKIQHKYNEQPMMSFDDNDEDDLITEAPKDNKQASRKDNSPTATPTLDQFCTDLTALAEKGGLDPVIGRDKEIMRVSQILSRRKKNNPVLIGEPGVGKSAIVEGLAIRIKQRNVSHTLFDKKILMLDLASVVAGTKYRGQFEERIKNIISELKQNKNIIVFIDELHTIVGSGAAAGSMDTANMLKPALARGEFQCIGATTSEEYRKVIEKDGALDRRFQRVVVEEPTSEETLGILRNIKDKYEEFHNVKYTDEAIKACVELSMRYVSGRSFPDKAIDVMDEAGARAHAVNVALPENIKKQETEIDKIKEEKSLAISRQDFETAANLRDTEKKMQIALLEAKEEWEKGLKVNKQTIDTDIIENIVSDMTGIPAQRLAKSERERLIGMADSLKSRVIGQDKAIDTVCKSIIRNRVGINNTNKPIGVFLFLGPTGVGKTYFVKQLAEFMFGDSKSLIRIDMSEYTEKYNVSRLVGAPPGYVGYEEGGQLTERVRKKPYSIVLLDEIEKAHSEVYNILLQIMDEGRLTDSYGRTVDFKNTIVIMTSNIGSRQLLDFPKPIGFSSGSNDSDNYSKDIMNKSLNKTFSPEFINRLDEIVSFSSLDKESLRKIVQLEIDDLAKRLQKIGHTLVTDSSVNDFIIDKGYNRQYGARPIKRAIQDYIEDEISIRLLNYEGQNCNITVKANEDGKTLSIELTEK